MVVQIYQRGASTGGGATGGVYFQVVENTYFKEMVLDQLSLIEITLHPSYVGTFVSMASMQAGSVRPHTDKNV